MDFFIIPYFLLSSSFLFLAPCRNSLFYKAPIFWVTFIWVLQPVLKFGIIPNSQMGKLRPREKGLAKVTQFIRAKPGLESWLFSFQFRVSGFPGGTSGKESTCQCRRCKRCGCDPWVRKIPWRRTRQPTPVFLPGNPMDREAWRARVHGVEKSWTWVSTHIIILFRVSVF